MLDNLIWHSLVSTHDSISLGGALARRYPADVSGFVGMISDNAQAWAELAGLVDPGETVVLTLDLVDGPGSGWEVQRRGVGWQMMLQSLADPPESKVDLVPLTTAHAGEMLELIALTKPGPFRDRTVELGGYLGVFDGGRLVAMAGHRMQTPGHTEISAVCTHPDAQRQGLASVIVHEVARRILAAGQTPILHIAADNDRARRVYERLGFVVRREVVFTGVARRDQVWEPDDVASSE